MSSSITPVITIITDTAGNIAPFTVHVSAENSNFAGINEQDCIFEWDFGYSNPSLGNRIESPSGPNPDNNQYYPTNNKNKINGIAFGWANSIDNSTETVAGSTVANSNLMSNLDRRANYNTMQRSINAAMTYWEAGTYTISLKIWYNGEATSTTTTNVTINSGSWTTKTVRSIFGDFTTLDAAINWVNAQPDGGHYKIDLYATSFLGINNTSESNRGLLITQNNVWITTSNTLRNEAVFDSNIKSAIAHSRNNDGDVLFNIEGSNILFDNLVFGTSSHATTKNTIAINIRSSTNPPSNITFHNCNTQSLRNFIVSDSDSSEIYINQIWHMKKFRKEMLNISGRYSVTQSMNYYELIGGIEDGSSSSADDTAIIKYNGSSFDVIDFCSFPNSSRVSDSNRNIIELSGSSFTSIMSNGLGYGQILFDSDSNSIRFDGNVLGSSGSVAGLYFNLNPSNIAIVNNHFTIGLASDGTGTPIAKFRTQTSISNIKINNNTIYAAISVNQTVASETAILDLRRHAISGSPTFSNIEVKNNIIIQNPAAHVTHAYCLDTSYVSQNVTISGNVYFMRYRDELPFAKIGSTFYSQSYWISNIETTALIEKIEPTHTNRMWDYKIDATKHPNVISNNVSYSSCVNHDYLRNNRDYSAPQKGCIVNDTNRFSDSNNFSISASLSDRSRSSYLAAPNQSKNIVITIIDIDSQVTDNNGNIGAKIINSSSPGLLRGVGDWIHTSIDYSVSESGDQMDVTITYTNDGPDGQTIGDSKQRIGIIHTGIIKSGNFLGSVDSSFVSNPTITDLTYKNINYSGLNYPGDYYCPVSIYFGSDYAVGFSIMYNIEEKSIKISDAQTSGYVRFTSDYLGSISSGSISDRNLRKFSYLEPWSLHSTLPEDRPTFLNADCLQKDESLIITYSIRIQRNPDKYVLTARPYKDFFAETYGEVTYAKDPRPFSSQVFVQSSAVSTRAFGFSSGVYTPDSANGWQNIADTIENLHTTYGFDRVFLWSPGGVYAVGSNYPAITVRWAFDDSFPHWDTTYNSFTLYKSPGESVNQIVRTFQSNILRISRIVPEFGFYQGYGDIYNTQWDPPTSDDYIYLFKDYDSVYSNFITEFDLARDKVQISWWGLDAYVHTDFNTASKYLRDIKNRHKDIRILTEASQPDFINRHATVFNFGRVPVGTNFLQHFLLPGSEIAEIFYINNYAFSMNPSDAFALDTLYRGTYKVSEEFGRQLADWGCVWTTYGPVDMKSDPSAYYAREARWDYETPPVPFNTERPAHPTGLSYTLYDQEISALYGGLRAKRIQLTWTANTEEDISHYKVYKAPYNKISASFDSSSTFVVKKYQKQNFYYDVAVVDDGQHYYYVTAVDIFGNESLPSETITIRWVEDDPNLSAPVSVTATPDNQFTGIKVAWS